VQPRFAIVRGNPSPEEIAAVVAVLAARLEQAGGAGVATAGRAARSGWSARPAMMRGPLPRGAGGWRASALPR
jgi:hypothetical protein